MLLISSGIALVYSGFPERINVERNEENPYPKKPIVDFSPSIVPYITLGHKYVYDHYLNMWLLQTLINPHQPQNAELLMDTIRAVLRHQPKAESLYILSCITMYQELLSPHYCKEISLAGLKVFPESWRIPMLQGYVHAFLTGEPAQAASFFTIAGNRPHSPTWVKRVAQKLINKRNISIIDIRKSLELLDGYQDPEILRFISHINQKRR